VINDFGLIVFDLCCENELDFSLQKTKVISTLAAKHLALQKQKEIISKPQPVFLLLVYCTLAHSSNFNSEYLNAFNRN
jgi:hypothetical protein